MRSIRRLLSVRAIQYESFGGPEVLQITNRELPEVNPGNVRQGLQPKCGVS